MLPRVRLPLRTGRTRAMCSCPECAVEHPHGRMPSLHRRLADIDDSLRRLGAERATLLRRLRRWTMPEYVEDALPERSACHSSRASFTDR